ncbi:hypothetical protein BDR05DRAFT_968682 [Suillus weaverae]|nr:hypothetical protein BDR05DRAFT_968682 [Suillus weaverae]
MSRLSPMSCYIPVRTRSAGFIPASTWDPYENLPCEYTRISEFEGLKRAEGNMVS